LTHALPHSTWPVGQPLLPVHTPLVHDWPTVQACPHAPQLFGSVAVFVQVPLHDVCPLGQPPPEPHVPPVQGTPLAHAVPHVPQFAGSEEGVVQ